MREGRRLSSLISNGVLYLESGDNSRRTRDQKVAGSNPCRIGGIILFSWVNYLCFLLFRYPFHPRVTAVARKRPRSFCRKCRWQVTAKHACTLRIWFCMKRHGAWLSGVHRTRRDGSSFMWHQPCQRCKFTSTVDIQKHAMKASHSCGITCERSGSARERRITLYKSDQQQQHWNCFKGNVVKTSERQNGARIGFSA